MTLKRGGDEHLETVISGICKEDINHSLTLLFLLIVLRAQGLQSKFLSPVLACGVAFTPLCLETCPGTVCM